jgi:hypothetical protein
MHRRNPLGSRLYLGAGLLRTISGLVADTVDNAPVVNKPDGFTIPGANERGELAPVVDELSEQVVSPFSR